MPDQYHPEPSEFMGEDDVWTANNRAPSPDYIFWNQLSWLVRNYGVGIGGKTSFTDEEFDVHNYEYTDNRVTLKFDLDPNVTGDVGYVTKYISVPPIAIVPLHRS